MSVVFFFFKQKTAYEMRISDWSSDVCSSDLKLRISSSRHRTARSRAIRNHRRRKIHQTNHRTARRKLRHRTVHRIRSRTPSQPRPSNRPRANRSEEHTSELQSLMRISYDVFCLKKQQQTNSDTTTTSTKRNT